MDLWQPLVSVVLAFVSVCVLSLASGRKSRDVTRDVKHESEACGVSCMLHDGTSDDDVSKVSFQRLQKFVNFSKREILTERPTLYTFGFDHTYQRATQSYFMYFKKMIISRSCSEIFFEKVALLMGRQLSSSVACWGSGTSVLDNKIETIPITY